ncbi:CLIP domain-containing serine protease 14D-like [Pollicipes pollicipes]|uniref:CLIP domain-containing serine protease 14D-like n=1 Tax=Pollicipes pollicipes TaxID=41117 RepID=UPI001884F6D8|nr:CLIP domain-containing serine protease 14D-like [Pollicipes pollicipes]
MPALVGDDDKGAPCVDSAGNPGVCSLLNQCASLRNRSIALQQQSVCGTKGSTTRVCCAEQSASAEAKCRRFVSPRDCGLSTFLSGRIANGLPVDSVTDFPWMALLQYSSGPISRCGGAIINDRWILTAAQCINSAGPVKVLLGDLNLATSTDDSFQHPPRVYNVEKAVKHPEYKRIVRGNRNGLFNDIALIKLTERISISPVMKPLCISEFPRPVSDLDGQAAYVAGWGVTEFVGPAEVLMRWARIGITRHAQCQEVYNSVYTAVDTTHVCANGEDERGGVDACAVGCEAGQQAFCRSDAKCYGEPELFS